MKTMPPTQQPPASATKRRRGHGDAAKMPAHPRVMYVLQGKATGIIKIGSTKKLQSRFNTISTTCPEELTLLAAYECFIGAERAIHYMFRDYHIRGEWFSAEVATMLGNIPYKKIDFDLYPHKKRAKFTKTPAKIKIVKKGNALMDYLVAHEIRAVTFAKLVGVSPSTVSRWMVGEMVPDMERMRKIADATDGRVMPNDFMTSPPGG